MANEYDVIIVGTGPNGLEAAAYLSKAGQKVLLLEKRFEAGGGLCTEQLTLPDFFHNPHAIYHMMVDYAPVYKDFDIEGQYGVRHIRPELQWSMPLSDGKSICIYTDVEKTCASIAKFSQKDADSYREMYRKYDEMMKNVVAPMTFILPEAGPIMAAKAEETEIGREMAAMTEKTPEEIINEMYENDHVRAMMLYICCHWGLDYNQSGVSFLIPLYLNRMVNYQLVGGGSHRMSNALLKSVFEQKGQIRTSAQIKRFIIENGEAKGVELEDGTQFMAKKAILSTIDPHQTFLKYVGEDKLESDFTDMIKSWQWEKWSLLHVHLAMEEPPVFKAAESNPDINNAFIHILGYETTENLKNHWEAMRGGELPDSAGINCCFPSVHDSYQAPPGRAAGLISQMAPFDRKDGGSERWLNYHFREEIVEQKITILQKYAPNITRDKVMWTYLTTPADIQNKYANMVKGSYKQGQYHPLQMGFLRPNQECSHCETPIKNLYVGGSSVYPGGCVIWGPGYNAANVIADDHGIEKWWKEPEIVTKARENNYI